MCFVIAVTRWFWPVLIFDSPNFLCANLVVAYGQWGHQYYDTMIQNFEAKFPDENIVTKGEYQQLQVDNIQKEYS